LYPREINPNLEQQQTLNDVLQGVEESLSIRRIRDLVERLDASADAKALIMDIATVTIKIGEHVVAIGRKIISFVFELVKRFPNTLFGVVIALTVSMLVASVPFIGGLLAPFITPLMLAFGVTSGAMADIKEAGVRSRIEGLEQQFAVIAAKG
jgi:hypothetical protein